SDRLWAVAEASGFGDLLTHGAPVATLAPARPADRRIDFYPTHTHAGYALRPGFPWPLGASVVPQGINFAVFSRHATACALVLFEPGGREPLVEVPFPPEFRVGDVFAMTVFGLDPDEVEYGFRMDGPHDPAAGHRFDRNTVLLDPMA